MQRLKWRKALAMLLSTASILGQTAPVAAQEVVVVTQEADSVSETAVTQEVITEETSEDAARVTAEENLEIIAAQQDPAENVALHKTAVASSIEADSVAAANATDGDKTSRSSRWGSNIGAAPHWIYVDLGEEMNVQTVGIYWETRKATAYKIQTAAEGADVTSEDSWKTVKSFAARPTDLTDEICFDEPETARYVRLYVDNFTAQDPDDSSKNWNSVSIYEIEVYGGKVKLAEQDPETNVARNKTAVADGVEGGTSFTADKVVDGDTSSNASRWSQYGVNAHWIYVDLGKVMDVKSVRLFWETRKASSYKIQLAQTLSQTMQESDWTDAKVINGHPASLKDTITLDSVQQARYVRLYINSFTSEDPDGGVTYPTISIYEMEIYGGDAPVDLKEEIRVVPPQAGDKKLQLILPEAEGKTITYNGTDYEQLVDEDLNIYQPVVDTTATVSVKIADNEDKTDYEFKEMTVTIPGQYTVEEGDNAAPNVLPQLREWKGRTGTYTITDNTQVVYKEEIFKEAAEALAEDYKTMTGKTVAVRQGEEASDGDIFFKAVEGKGLFKEGYLMDIDAKIVIEAEEAAGAYWATRTILQSIKSDESVPKGITRDYPLYEVRGFILDVGRKTFTMDYLKQVVKEMSWYKMNDFQIHLNDNYIFLENYTNSGLDPMKAYSGFRLESSIKKGGNGGLNKADLTNTDVYYTKDEFRDLIREARACGVNIVPEIDVPAHSLALTKVRPDLRHGTNGRQNDHLALADKFDECVEFVQSIFEEYMGTGIADPVFDENTIVHIGCDEYSASAEAFRNFSNVMIDYVQGHDRTVRMWGSLTSIKADVKVKSENVQMNLWNFDWANMDEMYEEGFDLINCNDGNYYIVPNAGYYFDYLNDGTAYNQAINSIGGVTIPAGDDQMLGGAFAVWNDMVDMQDNGISEWDIYDRIKKPMALFGAKLWGKHDLSLSDAVALSETLGDAPGTDFNYSTAADSQGKIAHYPMDAMSEFTANGDTDAIGVNAEIREVDGKNALELQGGESYVKTGLTTLGLENDIRVKVKRISASNKEQILFEGPYGSIKAVQTGTGKVGFSRENYDYSFNYSLPLGEWVELEFKNRKNQIQLYVNGTLTDTIGDDEEIKGRPLLATMMFPVEYIGSRKKAFVGYVDDVKIGRAAEYVSTIELDHALMEAACIENWREDTELRDLAEDAKRVMNLFAPSQSDIDNKADHIRNRIATLAPDRADYTNVEAYLAAIPEDLSIYTEESVSVLQQVKDSIRMGLPLRLQSTVDGYEAALAKALKHLILVEKGDVRYVAREDVEAITASSYQSNGEAPDKVMDGNSSTIWHTKYDKTAENDRPHWIQFELTNPVAISELVYVPRSGGGNGNFTGYEVKISGNGTDFTSAATGSWQNDGDEKTIVFTTPINAKYIRLYATSSVGNFGSAAEIRLKLSGITADKEGLQALITKVSAMEKGNYTDETWNALQTKLTEAKVLAEQESPNANDVEVMKRELSKKITQLRLPFTLEEEPEITGPFNLSIEVKSTTAAEITFEAAQGGENISYEIEVKEIGSEDGYQTSISCTETACELTGLPEGKNFKVIVTAKDSEGHKSYPVAKEFTLAYHTVTFDTGVEGVTIDSQNIKNGQRAAKPEDPEREGYIFRGWYLTGTEIRYTFTETVTKDLSLTALWKSKSTLDWGDILEEDREELDSIPTGIWTSKIGDLTYNGSRQTPEIRVYDGNVMLTAGTDYTITYKNNINAYVLEEENDSDSDNKKIKAPQIILKMKGNYKESKNIYFTISRADISNKTDFKTDDYALTATGSNLKLAPAIFWNQTGKNLKLNRDFTVTAASGSVQAAGTYQLTLKGTKNFTGERIINLTVVEAAAVSMDKVTVNVKNKSINYSGDKDTDKKELGIVVTYRPKGSKTPITLKEGINYNVLLEDTAAGTRSFAVVGIDNAAEGETSYLGTRRVTYKVNGIALNKAVVDGIDKAGYPYTGKEIKLLQQSNVSLLASKKGAEVADDTYTVIYTNNVNKGTASMILTGIPEKGTTGTKKITYKIAAADLKDCNAVFVNNTEEAPYQAGGAEPKFEVTRKSDGAVLVEGVDYTIKYSNNKRVNDIATATIRGKGNYTKELKSFFKVVMNGTTDTVNNGVKMQAADKAVDSTNRKPNDWMQKIKMTDAGTGKALKASEYSVTYEIDGEKATDGNAEIGATVTVKAVLQGDKYAGIVQGTYRIIKKGYDISKATIKIKAQEYTGDKICITEDSQFVENKVFLQISRGKRIVLRLNDEGDEKANIEVIGYQKNEQKGTAKVTFRAIDGNDDKLGGEKTVTFKITQRNITEHWWKKAVNSLQTFFE